jgi:hypothetical protein
LRYSLQSETSNFIERLRSALRRRSVGGPGGRTREQLYNDVRKLGIEGRSKMSKAQLQRAVAAEG